MQMIGHLFMYMAGETEKWLVITRHRLLFAALKRVLLNAQNSSWTPVSASVNSL